MLDPEEYLSRHGVGCGLNADWCVQAWHFGPASGPNMSPGDYYILDMERDGFYEIVRRFPGELNDEILTVMESQDVEHLVAMLRIILK